MRKPVAIDQRLTRFLPDNPAIRTMALATLVNTAGSGMYLVVAVLYFTRIIGLSPYEVGAGLTIAGFFGLVSGVPLGHLGDRYGARELIIWLLVGASLAAGAAALATSFWQFVVVSSVLAILDRGSAAVRGGLIATTVSGGERVRTRAYLRSLTNVGITIGAAVAALALHVDTRPAYVVVIVLNAATYGLTAFILRRYPHIPPTPLELRAPGWQVFRDRPYVLVTVLMATMAIQYSILDVGVPLWVTRETTAPLWIVSVMFILNTVVVVLFQVAVSRRVETVPRATRAISASGFVFLLACILFAEAQGRPVMWAVALLVAAALIHVAGELMQAAAQFCLSQELAPDHAQGQYQGLASTGFSLSTMIAPTVITVLPIGLGVPGWWLLGGCFVVLGLALLPAVAWAARTRDSFTATPPVTTTVLPNDQRVIR